MHLFQVQVWGRAPSGRAMRLGRARAAWAERVLCTVTKGAKAKLSELFAGWGAFGVGSVSTVGFGARRFFLLLVCGRRGCLLVGSVGVRIRISLIATALLRFCVSAGIRGAGWIGVLGFGGVELVAAALRAVGLAAGIPAALLGLAGRLLEGDDVTALSSDPDDSREAASSWAVSAGGRAVEASCSAASVCSAEPSALAAGASVSSVLKWWLPR